MVTYKKYGSKVANIQDTVTHERHSKSPDIIQGDKFELPPIKNDAENFLVMNLG